MTEMEIRDYAGWSTPVRWHVVVRIPQPIMPGPGR